MKYRSQVLLIAVVSFIVAFSISAWAVPLTGVTSVSGDIAVKLTLPSNVSEGNFESDTEIAFWLECTNFLLGSDLSVDITQPGTYPTPDALTLGSILSGTAINSYYLHFDPIGQDGGVSNVHDASGTITFSNKILGVIATNSKLGTSNFLKVPGVTYGKQGLEFNLSNSYHDIIGISNNMLTVSSLKLYANSGADNLRVITATPEPGSVMLLGFGLLGFGMINYLRKRKNNFVV